MKRFTTAAALCTILVCAPGGRAQEKTKGDMKAETKREITPIRVHVVVAEYDGDKKVSSLPYTLPLNAENPRGGKASIRMGLRVPIVVSGGEGAKQVQYQDLGTNLDGWAGRMEDGGFDLHLYVERSSAYSSAGQKTVGAGVSEVSTQPVIQQFKAEFDLQVREGQTLQSTLATDPLSGRVTKIEVTVNRVK
jgi:hypothetical protein